MHFRVNAQKSMVVNKVATLLFWMMMMATDGCYMSEILPSPPPTALFVATFLLHAFTEKVEDIFIFLSLSILTFIVTQQNDSFLTHFDSF